MDGVSACRAVRAAPIYHLLMVSQGYGADRPVLGKVCAAFGITLSQLFAEGDTPVSLTASQKKLLERWSRLNEDQQAAVFTIIDKMQ